MAIRWRVRVFSLCCWTAHLFFAGGPFANGKLRSFSALYERQRNSTRSGTFRGVPDRNAKPSWTDLRIDTIHGFQVLDPDNHSRRLTGSAALDCSERTQT